MASAFTKRYDKLAGIYKVPVKIRSHEKVIDVDGIIDTGANYCMISPKVATRLNLKPLGKMDITGANAKTETVPTYSADLCVDTLEYVNKITIAQYGDEKTDEIAILGNNFLSRFDLFIVRVDDDVIVVLQPPKNQI